MSAGPDVQRRTARPTLDIAVSRKALQAQIASELVMLRQQRFSSIFSPIAAVGPLCTLA
jgi:hypothetical protein